MGTALTKDGLIRSVPGEDGSNMKPSAIYPIERRALRINEAAVAYGIGRTSIYRLIADGKLRTVKIAGRRLIPREAMEALLNGEA